MKKKIDGLKLKRERKEKMKIIIIRNVLGKKEEYRRERIGQVDKEKSGRKETKRRKRKNWEGAVDLWAIVRQAK